MLDREYGSYIYIYIYSNISNVALDVDIYIYMFCSDTPSPNYRFTVVVADWVPMLRSRAHRGRLRTFWPGSVHYFIYEVLIYTSYICMHVYIYYINIIIYIYYNPFVCTCIRTCTSLSSPPGLSVISSSDPRRRCNRCGECPAFVPCLYIYMYIYILVL